MIDLIIMALEYKIFMLLDNLLIFMYEYWDNQAAALNHGQYTIFENYMRLAIEDWSEVAAYDWPWVDSMDYVEGLFSSYDSDVMERAFSDAIYNPVERMDEIIYRAQELQMRRDELEALMWF